MANRWEKEDRVAWTRSEVMQELEKKVLDNMRRVEAMAQKISLADATQAIVNNPTMSPEDKGKVLKEMNSPLDDALEDSDVSDDNEADDTEEVTKEAMIEELRGMVQAAISKGNIKVAYQIERTIEEILEEEL
tara:strand:- start:886 stop:1284 length:399 start_codon:yes stop_codon:yes gene_type:complete